MKYEFYSRVINHADLVPFDKSILPDGVKLEDILESLTFLSPVLLILYGSTVTRKRYSPSGESDLDIVCVTMKSGFWHLDHLYEEFKQNAKYMDVEIDLSILTCNEFCSVLDGNSSLSMSLTDGFTVLWMD